MSWVAVATAAVGAGVSLYNGYQQKKSLEGLANTDSSMFGSIPEGIPYEKVEYQPVNYGAVQMDTLHQQQRAMPDIAALTASINAALRGDSAVRIEGWSPGFTKNLKTMSDNATALLGGRLPYSDVLDIVSNRQNLGAAMGTPGTSTQATLKDLGMSQLGAMQTGSEMMARISNLAEGIDPIGDRSRPQEWMYTPREAIPWKIDEAKFAAELASRENQFAHGVEQDNATLAAMGDPAALGQYGAGLLASMGGGGMGSGVNWGQLAGAAVNAYNQWKGGGSGYYGGARYNPDSGSLSGTTYYNQPPRNADGTHNLSDRPAGMPTGY